jgi:signal transduction histidine kinase
LLRADLATLQGRVLADVVGAEIAEGVMSGRALGRPMSLAATTGGERWVDAVGTALHDASGAGRVQVMLHDVTLQHVRLQGLEAYARRAVTAREDQRRRIGRELHDGPLQSLVLLSRQLDAFEGAADPGDDIVDAREIIDETAGELRRISRALRPPILDDLGLIAALRAEVTGFGRRSGIAARFEATAGPLELPGDVELTLLRITQEALHNVERHAGARHVEVELACAPPVVRLSVSDDGSGMGDIPGTAELLASGKLGLVGMQERARLVGGEVLISSRAGEGTTLTVDVAPLGAALPPTVGDGPWSCRSARQTSR